MDHPLAAALAFVSKVASVLARPQVVGSAVAALLVLVVGARLRFGRGVWTARLASPAVRTDGAYAVFYLAGIYAFLISGPTYRLLDALVTAHAPFLRLGLLRGLPFWSQFFVASLVMDLVLYWTHRAMHRLPWLWAFHSVHHSQREMNGLANFRFHAGDVFLRGLAQFVPGLLLGVPVWVWLPSVWIQVALDCLAHTGLGWGYGPLGRVLVSPGFHRVHHSAEPGHRDLNFGMTYSFWDRAFGTAGGGPAEPAGYGLPGAPVPPSFLRQLAYPFASLAHVDSQRAITPAPPEAAS